MRGRTKATSALHGIVAMALVALLAICAGCGSGADETALSLGTDASTTVGVSAGSSEAPATTTDRTNPWTARKAATSTAATTSQGNASTAVDGGQSVDSTTSSSVSTESNPATSTTGTSDTRHTVTTAKSSTTTQRSTTTSTAGVPVLTVAGPSGTKSFTMAQLKAMDPAAGYWGVHKGDPPYTVNRYTGVALSSLMSQVGGLGSGSLRVDTSDNFPCVWEADRLAKAANGTYQVWDKTTGVESTAAIRLIVAYQTDGAPLDSSTGPLRLVPVTSASNLVSEGKYSPFLVVSLTVQ